MYDEYAPVIPAVVDSIRASAFDHRELKSITNAWDAVKGCTEASGKERMLELGTISAPLGYTIDD